MFSFTLLKKNVYLNKNVYDHHFFITPNLVTIDYHEYQISYEVF